MAPELIIKGVRSGDLGGHATGPPRPNQRLRKDSFEYSLMFIPKHVAIWSERLIYVVYWLQISCLLSVLYVCPSVRPHGTIYLPPDEFSWNPVIGLTGPWSMVLYCLGLTNLWRAAFTAVPFCISFARPASVYCEDYVYTGCFTTLGHNCRRWFPRSLWSKKFI